MKKRICWITATYFLDVDIPVVPVLGKDYDINWYILTTGLNEAADRRMIEASGVAGFELLTCTANFISRKTFTFYRDLLKMVGEEEYDLYYLDISGMPYFHFLAKRFLPVSKCIIAAHNVTTPKGARYYPMAKLYMSYIVKTFKNFQVFSHNQFNVLKSIKPRANMLYAPLCLKNYGAPTLKKPTGPVTFLFFGNIIEYKRLDVLLDAVNKLIARGVKDFKVKICGFCPEQKWNSFYAPMIQDKSVVECDIRRIPNDLIPDYFELSHYFVMPYQDIAQSGAMTVAFCYNLPVIASELDSFREYVSDKENGFFIESGNSDSLAEIMSYVIANHAEIYDGLREKQRQMIENKLSLESILSRYRSFFDSLCQN